jgi:hypothetical protein
MMWQAEDEKREMWDITWAHLQRLIPIKIKILKELTSSIRKTFGKLHRYPRLIRSNRRLQLEILFLQRELKRRTDYPEYRTYCEMYVVGMNVKNHDEPHINSYTVTTVRHDPGFLMSFAMWCEDNNMMVQSRKLMRIIERIQHTKIATITKENICNDHTSDLLKASKNVGQS